MQYNAPENTDALFLASAQTGWYIQLIEQLNKDFALMGDAVHFPSSTQPTELKIQLEEKIFRLLHRDFASYLNLLYIIDVPERDIKALDGSDLNMLAQSVCFLILKREWQKVWFKNHYK